MNALNLLFTRGTMSYYEHVFIARPEVAPQQVENIVDDIKKIVSDDGGDTIYTEYWGLKKLAYKINKSEKSYDFILNISEDGWFGNCLLYTSPSPRDKRQSRMPSSA